MRGEDRKALKDGVYRASLRGASTHVRERVEVVARELANGSVRPEAGKRPLTETRAAIRSGWRAVANRLALQGDPRLAATVSRFTEAMEPPLTDRERIARGLLAQVRARQREVRTL